MNYTLKQIARISKGIHQGEDVPITHIIFDSRKVIKPKTALFIALSGKIHDGHHYIQEAYNKGVRSFLVSNPIQLEGANNITVPDTLLALQQLAQYHRQQLTYPIIAITGSNGKTIVKEWLSSLLSFAEKKVQKSPKSYNSQLGVALSLLTLEPNLDYGIIEAGISEKEEMIHLADMIRPDIGIFTNLGSAHDEGFSSTTEKFNEKKRLFESCKTIISEDIYDFEPNKHHSWGNKGKYKVNIIDQLLLINNINYPLPFSDKASKENLIQCIVTLLSIGINVGEIQKGIMTLSPVKMRLEIKEGLNNCHIIDDTYNNDLVGFKTVLEFLSQQHFNYKRTLILSDVMETNIKQEDLYQEINELIQEYYFDRIILVGKDIKLLAKKDKKYAYYTDTQSLLQDERQLSFRDEIILIKGARKFQLEKIVSHLQQRIHRTTFEINLNALAFNLNYYRNLLKPNTKVMAMVKAFSYGTGDAEIAQLLEFQKVDYLAVAYVDEAIKLRKQGIITPIMVMNAPAEDFETIIRYNLEPEIYSLTQLNQLKNIKQTINIHLKIDTGMHRLGFEQADIPQLISIIKQNHKLNIKSVFTHLSSASNPSQDKYTHQQVLLFQNIVKELKHIQLKFLTHCLNSAGITRFPEYQFDMVRLGIGLYGIASEESTQHNLKQVGTLKTIVSQIKTIPKGETIGYNRKGKAIQDTRIATIAIGYADGFNRSFSNGIGKVYIQNKPFAVIGNVCMDMTMIDISDCNDIKEGDEVIIYGKQIPVQEIAKTIDTIPYELLTAIGERVKRLYYSEE